MFGLCHTSPQIIARRLWLKAIFVFRIPLAAPKPPPLYTRASFSLCIFGIANRIFDRVYFLPLGYIFGRKREFRGKMTQSCILDDSIMRSKTSDYVLMQNNLSSKNLAGQFSFYRNYYKALYIALYIEHCIKSIIGGGFRGEGGGAVS